MKTKTEMKAELASVVARKVEATKARMEYKRATDGKRGSYDSRLCELWSDCRSAGEEARFAGLAYAFVRGRRYWVAERTCRSGNGPSAYLIAKIADAPEADVKAWLAVKPSAEETAAWEAHVREAKERALARKAERLAARTARAAE
jgi:hypothetical protein